MQESGGQNMQRMMIHMENQYVALKNNLGIDALLA